MCKTNSTTAKPFVDPYSMRLYNKLEGWCGRHGINLKPPITRWGIFTVLITSSIFLLSVCGTLYTIYTNIPGAIVVLVFAGLFGFMGFMVFLVDAWLVYVWIGTGAHEPTDDIKDTLCKIERDIKELVGEIRKDRQSRHGQQTTSDKPEERPD
jgi:hypothetical protein